MVFKGDWEQLIQHVVKQGKRPTDIHLRGTLLNQCEGHRYELEELLRLFVFGNFVATCDGPGVDLD